MPAVLAEGFFNGEDLPGMGAHARTMDPKFGNANHEIHEKTRNKREL